MSAAKPLRSIGYIIVSIILGVAVGLVSKANPSLNIDAKSFGDLGKIFVDLIKAVAAPLLFFAVTDAIVTTEISWKPARRFLAIVAVNTILATAIGLTIANVFRPGDHLDFGLPTGDTSLLNSAKDKSATFLGFIDSLLPNSILEPFVTGNILGVVFLAVISGAALRTFHRLNEPWVQSLNNFIHGGYRISERVITWLVMLAPVAIFGVIAKSVGTSGFDNLPGLARYVGFALLGLSIQTFVVYPMWIIVTRRVPLRDYFRVAAEPVINAIGINSSLATLPLTLKALEKLNVSKESSRMAACIGTNLNNDGILLYEAFAVLIVAQALNIEMTLATQLSVAVICVIATLGIAGVPEAGIISLAVVLATLKIDFHAILPVLLTVDWIVARMRSVTNVMADITSSIAIDPKPQAQPQS
ncbi:MAG TPA: dicarboxylate/amino acid:cation symporter [Fimbriimonas sp.]|nr:dicarboxylate/amino acid:cation symporter [Fimbriimonas sp.]